ncbi:hypothetical protein OO5_00592 [Enterococcus faecalis V583]|uniref:hypothetical protein n=1 Tax=Enterococcus faecalis TaxID=1351 RepID=UPI000337C1A6|nr:hypothetical protein [Enterococcus faecalis]EOT52002.1 hypothetical protein OO5_00592 [Enterococcus faecalis V583]
MNVLCIALILLLLEISMNMVKRVGIDESEVSQLMFIGQQQGSFIRRVLAAIELTIVVKLSTKQQIEFLSVRLACKGVLSKARYRAIGKVN